MRAIGKLMQAFALVLLPLAVVMELTGGQFGLGDLMLSLGFGSVCFLLGRIIEGYAGSS